MSFRWALGWAALCFAVMTAPDGAHAATIAWHACPPVVGSAQSAAVMRCGVFEPGETLAGRPVHIHFARLQARPDRPTPHPIIYVPGGPGDPGGLSPRALGAWRGFQQRAAWPRDLVIFDPRGTGRSTPRPACPAPSSPEPKRDGLAGCFRALGGRAASRLGARAQVSDLHRLIASLGQGGAILWAESYGVLIARRLAARYPSDVRMMVLDSPVLTPQSSAARQSAAFGRRRGQLIRQCERDLSCGLAVPSLGFVVDGLIAALHEQPAVIDPVLPPQPAQPMTIDGRRMQALIMLSAYRGTDDGEVVRSLRQALRDSSALAPLARPLLALDERASRTAPVYWSTRCQLTPRHGPSRPRREPCAQWPVPPLAHLTGSGAVPTLAIAGSQDVLTPARTTARAVLGHPGWQFLPVESAGHGVLGRNQCAQRVVARFIERGGAWLGSPRCTSGRSGAVSPEQRSNDADPVSR